MRLWTYSLDRLYLPKSCAYLAVNDSSMLVNMKRTFVDYQLAAPLVPARSGRTLWQFYCC